ncbi:MAG: sigma-54 dependent transcriptional regulator [Burkholderiaceae bacterium]|nr:sigma-54 dependent transcriptional regulator [Burkholderiaceae bacterium]
MSFHGELIGEHASIVETRRLIAKVARSSTRTVLLYGETGTGKGLVARMLHEQSARASGEFIDVNCAAIPVSLMESELFGYDRGAFTGAMVKKTGLIEAAHGGTMFLDEVRELDPVLQAKLLSLLDTQRFRRVGSVRSIEVDVRFIAATNKILLGEVRKGLFRDDLYYRLQVVSINIPALRERGEDVMVLTEHFMRTFSARYGRTVFRLEPAVIDLFARYSWPGNVRELSNLLERIFILEEGETIRIGHIPPRIVREARERGASPAPSDTAAPDRVEDLDQSFAQATDAFQRDLIRDALERSGGNRVRAGQLLGLTRHALRHQMVRLGLVD